jgi:hypothetical protein
MSFTLIETKTLGADAASIEFTSIPQTFTDLVVLCSLRSTESAVSSFGRIEFNGVSTVDSGSSRRDLSGSGSAATSSGGVGSLLFPINGSTSTANTFGNGTIYVPNYTAAVNKSLSIDAVNENNATAALQFLIAGLWPITTAISSLQINNFANSLVAGSTISLYGITKGSDGIVTTS